MGRPVLSGYNPEGGRPHLPNTLADRSWLAAGRSREARGGGAPLFVYFCRIHATTNRSLQSRATCSKVAARPLAKGVRDGARELED